jgi:hypothetical protein
MPESSHIDWRKVVKAPEELLTRIILLQQRTPPSDPTKLEASESQHTKDLQQDFF